MAEEPQAATPRTRPKRRYTLSAKVPEANRRKLEKARAVAKEIPISQDRAASGRLPAEPVEGAASATGPPAAPTRAWPRAVRGRVGWPGGHALRGQHAS